MLLMAERGRLFGSLPAGGRMVAVFAAAERVESLTDEFPSLSVAAYNGANTVLSGPGQDLEQAVAEAGSTTVCAVTGWTPATPSIRRCWIRSSTNSSRMRTGSSSVRRKGHWCATAPARPWAEARNWTAPTGAATRGSRSSSPRVCAHWPISGARCCWRSVRNRCSPPRPCGHGRTRPPHRGRSRRCGRTSPTTDRSPKPLPTRTSSATCPTSVLSQQGPARKLDLPTYPFQHRQYWFREQRVAPTQTSNQHAAMRTEAVGLLEDGRIEELAALLDGGSGNQQTLDVLTQLAAQHNQQRGAQSITDSRYEIRWEKSAARPGAKAGEGSAWLLISDDAEAVQPLVDALTARWAPAPDPWAAGVRRGRGAARRRVARCGRRRTDDPHPASRGPRSDTVAVDAVAVADATPSPERDTATLPRRGRR